MMKFSGYVYAFYMHITQIAIYRNRCQHIRYLRGRRFDGAPVVCITIILFNYETVRSLYRDKIFLSNCRRSLPRGISRL